MQAKVYLLSPSLHWYLSETFTDAEVVEFEEELRDYATRHPDTVRVEYAKENQATARRRGRKEKGKWKLPR